jgi:hypothetical protein
MRAIAVLSPFLFVAMLEVSFRLVGAYEEDAWANPNVSFAEDAVFFPAWDEEIAMPKPQGALRIVALGGSTTFGFGVDEPFAPLVERQLSLQRPGQRIEVINGGAHAVGSHRVFEILKRAEQFDVDIALVYLGHNEFLEEIFFDPKGLGRRAEQIGGVARRLRVVRWLKGISGFTGETQTPTMQKHFFGNTHFPLIRSEDQYALRLDFFESTLTQMIKFAAAHDIQIIFIPAVPNLLSTPGDSIHGPGYHSQSKVWDDLFAQAAKRLNEALAQRRNGPVETQQWLEISARIDQLHVIDDQFAMTHYMLGQAWLAQGEWDRGVLALERANMLDKRGDRVNCEVMDRLLRVCTKHHVVALDLREAFYSHLGAEFQKQLSGEPLALFMDHCHPTPEGHQMIADAFVQSLAENDR